MCTCYTLLKKAKNNINNIKAITHGIHEVKRHSWVLIAIATLKCYKGGIISYLAVHQQ